MHLTGEQRLLERGEEKLLLFWEALKFLVAFSLPCAEFFMSDSHDL